MFKRGTNVRLKIHPIEGMVLNQIIVEDKIQYKIEYLDELGNVQTGYFHEDKLEEMT